MQSGEVQFFGGPKDGLMRRVPLSHFEYVFDVTPPRDWTTVKAWDPNELVAMPPRRRLAIYRWAYPYDGTRMAYHETRQW